MNKRRWKKKILKAIKEFDKEMWANYIKRVKEETGK